MPEVKVINHGFPHGSVCPKCGADTVVTTRNDTMLEWWKCRFCGWASLESEDDQEKYTQWVKACYDLLMASTWSARHGTEAERMGHARRMARIAMGMDK